MPTYATAKCSKCKLEVICVPRDDYDAMHARIASESGLEPDDQLQIQLQDETGQTRQAVRLTKARLFSCPNCGHGNLLSPRGDPGLN